MKTIVTILAVSFFAASIMATGCSAKQSHDDNDRTESWNGTNHPDSADTSMTDVTKNAVGQNSERVQNTANLSELLTKNIADMRMQLDLSQMVAKKVTSHPGKQLADQMVKDHTRLLNQLKEVAAKNNIEIPNEPLVNPDREMLEKVPANQFNSAWQNKMIEMHKAKVQELESVMNYTPNAEVKAVAFDQLQVMKGHIEKLEQVGSRY